VGALVSKSRISKKWLTTVPAEVRRALNLKVGDVIRWRVLEDGKTVVVDKEEDPLSFLTGRRADPDTTYDKVEGLADELIKNLAGESKDSANRA